MGLGVRADRTTLMMINRKRDLGPRPPLMEVSEVIGGHPFIAGWFIPYPIGSMVLLYMVTWIPSIYPNVSIPYMDPMGIYIYMPWKNPIEMDHLSGHPNLCPKP